MSRATLLVVVLCVLEGRSVAQGVPSIDQLTSTRFYLEPQDRTSIPIWALELRQSKEEEFAQRGEIAHFEKAEWDVVKDKLVYGPTGKLMSAILGSSGYGLGVTTAYKALHGDLEGLKDLPWGEALEVFGIVGERGAEIIGTSLTLVPAFLHGTPIGPGDEIVSHFSSGYQAAPQGRELAREPITPGLPPSIGVPYNSEGDVENYDGQAWMQATGASSGHGAGTGSVSKPNPIPVECRDPDSDCYCQYQDPDANEICYCRRHQTDTHGDHDCPCTNDHDCRNSSRSIESTVAKPSSSRQVWKHRSWMKRK